MFWGFGVIWFQAIKLATLVPITFSWPRITQTSFRIVSFRWLHWFPRFFSRHQVNRASGRLLVPLSWIFFCFSKDRWAACPPTDTPLAWKTPKCSCSLIARTDVPRHQIYESQTCSKHKTNHYVLDNANRALILVHITVVRGRKYSQRQLFVTLRLLIIVSLNLHLMPADDHLYLIGSKKVFCLSHPVVVRAASHLVRLPVRHDWVLGWVAPHQIAYDSLVWDFDESVYLLDLFWGLKRFVTDTRDLWRDSAMDCEVGLVDDCAQG